MTKTTDSRDSERLWVVSIVLLLLATGVAITLSIIDAGNWNLTDTGNLVISVLLGVYFFILAQQVNRRSQERANAVANADLITSTGVLAMNSARSLSGSESAALRVAADVRAALQHYPLAEESTKEDLRASVTNAYNDLAFSTFLRADSLARSVWRRLCEGTSSVVSEMDELSFKSGKVCDQSLRQVSDHVSFVEMLGRALRDNAGLEIPKGGHVSLSMVWDISASSHSEESQASRPNQLETKSRLERFRMLYKDELMVYREWAVLERNADHLDCDIELVDCAATSDWLAPWYVGDGNGNDAGPVSVLGRNLEEAAQFDRLRVNRATPRWPRALEHGNLPKRMRAKSITSLRRVLMSQPSPTICVLVYELCLNEQTGEKVRLVLDGNHRLAAARQLSLTRTPWWKGNSSARNFKILTFLISERQAIDETAPEGSKESHPYEWKGFTPDIGLRRGTWRPA